MQIAHRSIGPDFPPLVVAEIGINHGGSLKVAKGMVLAAAQSGCEMVKHQTHILDDEMTEEAKSIVPGNADTSIWSIMESCALNLDEEAELKRYTESLGLIWISTPFSRAALKFLETLDVPAYKIGSGEADNIPLIRMIAATGKPVIMSTGMHTIESLMPGVEALRAAPSFALLECTNLYPSPPEHVSLQGMGQLRQAFPDAVIGFSDHSMGPHMALAAVALGANIIERHFTDSRYRVGPDISCSMDPAELRFLIDRSREIWEAGRRPKHRAAPEETTYAFARASLIADRDLVAGQVISADDIWAKRPGNGEIAAISYDAVIGRTVSRNIQKNQQLSWADFV